LSDQDQDQDAGETQADYDRRRLRVMAELIVDSDFEDAIEANEEEALEAFVEAGRKFLEVCGWSAPEDAEGDAEEGDGDDEEEEAPAAAPALGPARRKSRLPKFSASVREKHLFELASSVLNGVQPDRFDRIFRVDEPANWIEMLENDANVSLPEELSKQEREAWAAYGRELWRAIPAFIQSHLSVPGTDSDLDGDDDDGGGRTNRSEGNSQENGVDELA
jgi:hypothetical protein